MVQYRLFLGMIIKEEFFVADLTVIGLDFIEDLWPLSDLYSSGLCGF